VRQSVDNFYNNFAKLAYNCYRSGCRIIDYVYRGNRKLPENATFFVPRKRILIDNSLKVCYGCIDNWEKKIIKKFLFLSMTFIIQKK